MRYRVTASLASREFEQVLVDVGLAPPPVDAEVVQAPDLLDFAGVAPVRALVIPAAWHVAEKVHAYTRQYGANAAPSSRPKDLDRPSRCRGWRRQAARAVRRVMRACRVHSSAKSDACTVGVRRGRYILAITHTVEIGKTTHAHVPSSRPRFRLATRDGVCRGCFQRGVRHYAEKQPVVRQSERWSTFNIYG